MSRTNDRKQELLDMIDAAQAGYEKYEPKFQELSSYYLAIMDEEMAKSLMRRKKSHIFFPKINAKVKRIVASFQESYFSTDTFASIASSDEEYAEKANMLQEAMDYYTTHKMKPLFLTFTPIFYQAPVFGTVVSRTYWDGEKPVIDHVHLKDIRFDPSARTQDDIRFYVHDIYLTADDIRKLQRAGVYTKEISADDLLAAAHEEDNTTAHSRIKLQEVYTQNAKGQWTVSTFYDNAYSLRQDVVLQDGQPFDIGELLPQMEQPNEENIVRVYGDSPIAPIIALQNEVNIRRNQQIDAIKKHLEPQMLIPSASGLNPIDVERGSRFLRIKNPTAVQLIPAPDINSSTFDVQQLDMEMSENIGISAQQNGIGSSTKQTATESSILSNEGNSRNQAYMRSFNETFFKRIFKRTAQLVWKHGDNRFFAGVSRQEPFEFVARINTGLGATNKEIQLAGIEKSHMMISKQFEMAMALQNANEAMIAFRAVKKLNREALPLMGIENTEKYLGDEKDDPELGQNNSIGSPSGIAGMEDDTGGIGQGEGIPLLNNYDELQGVGAY